MLKSMTPLERFYHRLESAPVSTDDLLTTGFLTHRVDVEAIRGAARALAEQLPACDLLLTVEASGIAPAFALAEILEVPFVFARRNQAQVVGDVTRVILGSAHLHVAREMIPADARVLIVDDFLGKGMSALALVRLVYQCEAIPVGFASLIEKTWDHGRSRLEVQGIPVFSLVQLATDGRSVFLERRGLHF